MTEQPLRVRAVARVDNAPSARGGPATLVPRPRHHHLGPVHLLQLLVIEGVLLAVLAMTNLGPVAMAAAALVGAALLVVVLGRRKRRWFVERRLMIWHFRRRRHGREAGEHPDPRLTALRSLAPGLSVRDVSVPDGSQVGVARDSAGWFAVAAVTTTAAMRDDPTAGLPLDRLARLLADAETPGAVLQVVTHTVPAPSLNIDRGCAAEQSYRELLNAIGAAPAPRDRVTWIALRVDARSIAEDAEGEDVQPPVVVATLIRRVVSTLRRTGRTWHVLDADGLLAALARSCDLDAAPTPGIALKPVEDWTSWRSARLAHASYWVRDWPEAESAGELLARLSEVPAALTSVAVALTPVHDAVDVRGLVRVAAPPATLAQVTEGLVQTATQSHAQLLRLDGEQAPAVYATAPTGGGVG